ncbi:helix-turn-helix domain-containing protein [Massilia sp. GER05]|uniref:helix-turn-helix domain-containing protein n=1 Tax=Massilia sp. GER05 TaxID=3394605 RepID=UPI003F856BF9
MADAASDGNYPQHLRTRIRAQSVLRLSQGLTSRQTAGKFMVHLNSVEQWRQRWIKLRLAGSITAGVCTRYSQIFRPLPANGIW